MNIELRPHVGKKKRRGPDGAPESVDVELDQYEVLLVASRNGAQAPTRLGYVGKKPGAPLILIARLSDAQKQEVREAVARLKDGPVGRTAETPSLVDPPADD